MGILRSSGQSPGYIPRYTGLQIQTSSNAVPISLVYGVNKIAPNIVWTGGFYSLAQYSKTGGKGGGNELSGYNYYTSFAMGICEGPITEFGTVWRGQSITNLYGAHITATFKGTTPQTPWGVLTARFPSQALSYGGLAYIGAFNYSLGSSPTLPQFSFEIYGRLNASSGINLYDADPALIIQDFLTNAQYGVGFPPASIDATTLLGSSGGSSYQTYCQASYLALSPALTNQEAASAIMARWLQLTNTAAVWSAGKLKFIPYGDTAVTGETSGGLVTFNPNVTPIYNLTDDDFVFEDGKDPVEIVRSDPYASYNWQRLQISQRSHHYDSTPIDAFDQNAIELYGLRMASDITANEICDPQVGQISVQLILQRGLYIRNSYSFKLSFEYCLLEPMDVVTITDSGLGLNNAAVRIMSIDEDDAGVLTVTAEEFPGNTATAVQYPVQTSSSNSTNQGLPPAQVNTPIIFEPPPALLIGAAAAVWIAVSGGTAGLADPNWGGCFVYISTDNITFGQIGQVNGPARQGVLSASLASYGGSNPDLTHMLSVDLTRSGGTLESGTVVDAQNAVTLCLVDNEFLAFATATLTGTNAYDLTYLERGLYGSPPVAHASGAPFVRLDQAIFKYTLPSAFIGVPLYLKFQSFNVFGQAVQDLSTCTVYSYTPVGSGMLGPVAQALLIGTNLDYGLASASVNQTDDFGLASDPYATVIELGLASA